MFQVESSRSVAVHPLEPATSAFTRAASGVVAENLDTLLGERLLPLRLRHGDEDAPYLLAVDASGQPVVVEIVPVLDEVAVLRALRHAGRAAGMSAQDLASVYRGGATRFAAHLAAFRRTVPATTLLSTAVRSGARLLLVCSAIADGVQDVVEFLLQPGWQVDILQVGVVPGADGARIVDVYPLTRTPPPRRAMEPQPLRVVRTGEAPPPRAPGLSTPPHGEPGPAGHHGPSVPRGSTGPQPTVRPDPARRMPSVAPPPFAVRMSPATPAAEAAVAPAGAAGEAWADQQWAAQPAPAAAPSQDPEWTYAAPPQPEPQPVPRSRDEHVATPVAEPTSPLPYAFTGVAPAPAAEGPDAALAAVAAYVGAPAALVWSRDRHGEHYEAMLHEDGWIELPDGRWFAEPGAAAEAVSASDLAIDGWRVWRLDRATGPTLADVHDELVRAGG